VKHIAQIPCTIIIPYNYFNLIVPSATIIAAAVGGWWVYIINKANSIRTAKYAFISSILECFEGIYPARIVSNSEIFASLEAAYPKINIAVHKFRFYVPSNMLPTYDNAWKEYEHWYKSTNESNIMVHVFYGKGNDPYKELRDHIESLLYYAKT